MLSVGLAAHDAQLAASETALSSTEQFLVRGAQGVVVALNADELTTRAMTT